jgi:hypothetical protein
LYKEYEDITKQLKKKKLAISDWKLTEYDQILNQVKTERIQKCHSHKHELTRHPKMHHNGWRCDMIKGVNRCLSGITDFYQVNSSSVPIYGWRCQACDFDLCFRCLSADIFLNETIINRED